MALGACTQTPRSAGPSGVPAGVQVWQTTGDRARLLAPLPPLARQAQAPGAGVPVFDVDAARQHQAMVGFGASITDATAWLMQHRMSAAQRAALLRELFGRGEGGVGFELTRLTLGASDFSLSHYTYNDLPPGEADPALARFSIAPMRAEVLPTLKEAQAVNPGLKVMASPWSAPAWMKTNGHLYKGRLKPEHFGTFSRYLVRYVQALQAEGVPVMALTLQNEPHFEPDDYPGMRLENRDRAEIIGRHLGPLLKAEGLATQIIEWDHNWDVPQAPLEVLADPVARPFVSGVGWHCYAGEVGVMARVRDQHPDKDVWFTECSGGQWKPHWPETLPWMVRNIVIGTTRGGARGVQMWNLALDETHGPHLGGCKDCRGVVTIDSRSGEVTRNLEYYALAHASKFVRPGARRIDSTFSHAQVQTVAFRNVDDGSLVLLACNSAPTPQAVAVREGGKVFETTLPRESITTFVWRP